MSDVYCSSGFRLCEYLTLITRIFFIEKSNKTLFLTVHSSRSSPILFYNSWKVCCRLLLCKWWSTGHCCGKHYRTHSLCLCSLYTRNVVKSTGESGVGNEKGKKHIQVQKRNGCETAVTSTTLHFLFSFRKNTALQSQLTWRCVRRELNICLCVCVCVS